MRESLLPVKMECIQRQCELCCAVHAAGIAVGIEKMNGKGGVADAEF